MFDLTVVLATRARWPGAAIATLPRTPHGPRRHQDPVSDATTGRPWKAGGRHRVSFRALFTLKDTRSGMLAGYEPIITACRLPAYPKTPGLHGRSYLSDIGSRRNKHRSGIAWSYSAVRAILCAVGVVC